MKKYYLANVESLTRAVFNDKIINSHRLTLTKKFQFFEIFDPTSIC